MWKKETRERVGDYGSGQALSDQQFACIEPFIPAQKPGGRSRTTDMRKTLDAIFYVTRVGCQWRHLPPPPIFPPWQTTYGYFRLLSSTGCLGANSISLEALAKLSGRVENNYMAHKSIVVSIFIDCGL